MPSSAAPTPAVPPDPAPLDGPLTRGGFPVWSARHGPVEVRFVGRDTRPPRDGAAASAPSARAEVLAAVAGRSGPVAGLRQIHSDRVLPGREGLAGEGDALWTGQPGLVLSVVTADCVPVILAGPADRARPSSEAGRNDPPEGPAWVLAAVHAGWRGIAAGVVPRSVEALGARGVSPPWIAAWIGPSIGACCYEVSEDVAIRVASAAGAECVVPQDRAGAERPHLDLAGAVRHQLAATGVPAPRIVVRCTRCDGERLWSYRREGRAAGRNHAFAWIDPAELSEDPCG